MNSPYQNWLGLPTLGLAVALVLTVIGARLTVSMANRILLLAFCLATVSVYELPPLARLEIVPRLLWACLVASIMGLLLFQLKWSPEPAGKLAVTGEKPWAVVIWPSVGEEVRPLIERGHGENHYRMEVHNGSDTGLTVQVKLVNIDPLPLCPLFRGHADFPYWVRPAHLADGTVDNATSHEISAGTSQSFELLFSWTSSDGRMMINGIDTKQEARNAPFSIDDREQWRMEYEVSCSQPSAVQRPVFLVRRNGQHLLVSRIEDGKTSPLSEPSPTAPPAATKVKSEPPQSTPSSKTSEPAERTTEIPPSPNNVTIEAFNGGQCENGVPDMTRQLTPEELFKKVVRSHNYYSGWGLEGVTVRCESNQVGANSTLDFPPGERSVADTPTFLPDGGRVRDFRLWLRWYASKRHGSVKWSVSEGCFAGPNGAKGKPFSVSFDDPVQEPIALHTLRKTVPIIRCAKDEITFLEIERHGDEDTSSSVAHLLDVTIDCRPHI